MIKGLLLDLDGTVYHGHEEVPGAARFIGRLPQWGVKPLFVTNRANRTPAAICEQLKAYGIACAEDNVLTSAQATVQFLPRGSVFCIGEEGMRQALDRAGFPIVEENPDYAIVSFDRDFNYATMKRVCRMICGGAKFIATNPDKCLHTERGVVPGTGAIVAAVAAGCGKDPMIIGKPERRIFDMAIERLGVPRDEVVAVGDNLATDILAGRNAGIRTVLLTTGASTRAEVAGAPAQPTWTFDTFDELEALVEVENR